MSAAQAEPDCTYVPRSNEPCETCPKQITCLYMCKFLQEGAQEAEDGNPDER